MPHGWYAENSGETQIKINPKTPCSLVVAEAMKMNLFYCLPMANAVVIAMLKASGQKRSGVSLFYQWRALF